eukprot:symbB.v1.2.009536.t2/scaffold576.1/size184938/10
MLRHLWRNESEMLMSEGEEAGHSLRSLQDTDQQPSNRNSWPLVLAFTSFLLVFSLSVFATGKHGDGHAQATKSYGSYGDYRSLKGKAMDQLQDFVLHGTIPGECEGCHGPKQTKSICSKGPSTTRRLEDAPSYERQAQDHVFQGRIDAAADCYEKALRIRLKSGDKPSQLVHAAEVLARASNHACKDASVPKAGERQLQRTLGLLYDVRDSGCAGAVLLSCINLTLANLAALHTRAGRHTTALRYLREAEALGAPPAEAAATHLSLCALLSQLGRHKEAEHHAAEAVALGEADILELSSHRSEGVTPALLREKASALAVAYNNRAVQREYLGGEDCLALYEKAVVLAEGHMEKENPLLIRLQESHRNALQISVGRKSHRRPSSAVNVRSAPRRDAEVKRPVSAVESRRASSASSRAKPNLDQELLRLLRPEEQHVLAARHKAREGADDNPEVPLSAPTLPRHMRVALEQQREGARCHQAVGTWVEDGHGRDCAGISGTSGTSDMSSRRRETGDPRLQHALHFAGCEAARRIQQAYRKHLWFLKVRREARQARKKAADAQRPTPETPSIESIQPRPRLQSLHEVSRDSLPQRVSNFRAVSTETQSEKIEKDEILKHSLHHSAPSDALPRPRAMELTNGLPQRTLPSLGSNPGSLALGSCTKVAEMQPKEIQDKAGSKLLERQQAAATIQASWARFRQLKRQNMAMWMQAMVRYRLQRQEFLEQVHATKQIQRKWRIHSANQRAHQHVKDQADLAVQQEPEEEEMPATQTLEHQEEKRNEVNEACQVQEELPVQQEPEEQEMPATQTLDALEEEKQEKHDVNEACQVQEELSVRHEPEEQEMPATQTLDAQEEEKQQKHEANEACQVQEELPVQQEPEEQEMPLDAPEEKKKEKHEVNEACEGQEGIPVQQGPEEQEVPTLELQQEQQNEGCQVQEELAGEQDPGEELESAESEHQKQHGQRQQQAAAIIQASWTRARRRNMLSMAVWMQAMLRCRLQQQLFLQHCHAPRTLQKAAVSVADDEGVEVDCISNDSRDTTASEEESKVFKPKCDAWACAQCGLVNEAPNNLASTMGQLQDFLNGKPVKGQCPEAEPVLAIAMPVNLKEANGLSELFLPMLIRAARSSVSTMMQVPDQVISVTLSHPVETRLLSMQETVEQAEKGSKFNIVAEVSSPPQEAMQAAMGSQFLEDFQEEVSAALIREGAEAGTGNFHQIAQFDTPVLEEKSSLDVEGFKSEGFGTVCETYRQKQLQPGEVEEKQVGSVRACAQACAGSKGCQGFQFGHAQKTCKLWKTGVCRSQEAVGPMKLECYRKCA